MFYRRIYMSLRSRAFSRALPILALFIIALTSSAVFAQDQPTPKVDVFAGYSWYNPGLRVNGIQLGSDAKGFAIAPTYNFSRNFGFTLDGSGHFGSSGLGQNQAGNIMAGPRLMLRQEHLNTFVHALVGLQLLTVDSAVPGGAYNNKGVATM